MPVCTWRSVTLAPVTTAPLGSVTVPTIAVEVVWALKGRTPDNTVTASSMFRGRVLLFEGAVRKVNRGSTKTTPFVDWEQYYTVCNASQASCRWHQVPSAKLGNYHVAGLDISRTFVDIARRNAADARVDVEFRQGNAASMPFEDDSFDFPLCRAAFKNFAQPVRGLQEMHRVLHNGGRALIIDLRRDASQQSIDQAVEGMGLGIANSIITK